MVKVFNNKRGTQKKVEGAPLFCTKEKKIDETFLSHQKTLLIFSRTLNLETCINASSPKARRGVSSLSLILLFYCY